MLQSLVSNRLSSIECQPIVAEKIQVRPWENVSTCDSNQGHRLLVPYNRK
jgi:hypothetical protein